MASRKVWTILLLALMGLAVFGSPAMAAGIDEGAPASTWPQVTVATVSFQDRADLDQLAARLDILAVDHDARTFDALLRPDQLDALRAEGRAVQVDAAQSALLNAPRMASPGQVSGIPGFACYRTVEETYTSLEQLAAANPTLATWTDVGDSWDKVTSGGNAGYDIYALVLTNQAIPGPKPKLMVISAIHAREYATAELTTRFAELLINNYGIDPDITWLVDYHELHLIPQANPDGRKEAEGGRSWRKNVNNSNGCTTYPYYGTDLNRNSSFMWNQGGSSSYSCDELYHGPAAASEPEVQTVESYAAAIFPDRKGDVGDPAPATTEGVFLTIHSYGQLVLYPWGFTSTDAPNGPALATLGRKFGYFNNYAVCQDCLYAVSGATDDYTYGELGVPSYTFEIGTTFFQSCAYFEQNILPRNLPALLYALKAVRRPYEEPSGPEVTAVSVSTTTVSAGAAVTLTASADDTRFDSNGYGSEPFQNVVAARYSVNTPPWAAGTAFFPMQAGDGTLDSPVEALTATIDTTGWAPGRSIIYVQAQDGSGQWGVPSAVFLDISPPTFYFVVDGPTAQAVAPGKTVTHPLLIQNAGSVTDSYTLTLSSPISWTVQMTNAVGPLGKGEATKVPVTVQVPVTAPHAASQLFTVTVRSVGDPTRAISLPVTTTVEVRRGVSVSPGTASVETEPDRPISVTLTVQNTGNVTDTFGFSYTSTQQADWAFTIMPTVTLGAGASTTRTFSMLVPASTAEGTYSGQLSVTSQSDSTKTTSISITVKVIWKHIFLPEISR